MTSNVTAKNQPVAQKICVINLSIIRNAKVAVCDTLLFVRLLHMTLTLILTQDDDDEGGAAARDKSHIVEQFTGVGIKVRMRNMMCVLHYHHTISFYRSVACALN